MEMTRLGPHAARGKIGTLAADLVQSVLPNSRRWPRTHPIPCPFDDQDGYVYPDLFWKDQTAMVEVKAGIKRFYVRVTQHRSYDWIRDNGTLPVYRPRLFYAFVHYKPAGRVGDMQEKDLTYKFESMVKSILILDSRIVDYLAIDFGDYGKDWSTPLSERMGGAWTNLYRITPARLRPFLDCPVEDVPSTVGTRVVGWPEFSRFPTRVLTHQRRPRRWHGALPFE